MKIPKGNKAERKRQKCLRMAPLIKERDAAKFRAYLRMRMKMRDDILANRYKCVKAFYEVVPPTPAQSELMANLSATVNANRERLQAKVREHLGYQKPYDPEKLRNQSR